VQGVPIAGAGQGGADLKHHEEGASSAENSHEEW
jgi:hypothetical protein